jgi:hypothetical protein
MVSFLKDIFKLGNSGNAGNSNLIRCSGKMPIVSKNIGYNKPSVFQPLVEAAQSSGEREP